MSSFQKFTRQGNYQQVFIQVYRLEIPAVMLVFSTQLCELTVAPLPFTLPPSPLLCVWRSGPQTDKHLL
jgi:hypothetical protein